MSLVIGGVIVVAGKTLSVAAGGKTITLALPTKVDPITFDRADRTDIEDDGDDEGCSDLADDDDDDQGCSDLADDGHEQGRPNRFHDQADGDSRGHDGNCRGHHRSRHHHLILLCHSRFHRRCTLQPLLQGARERHHLAQRVPEQAGGDRLPRPRDR